MEENKKVLDVKGVDTSYKMDIDYLSKLNLYKVKGNGYEFYVVAISYDEAEQKFKTQVKIKLGKYSFIEVEEIKLIAKQGYSKTETLVVLN